MLYGRDFECGVLDDLLEGAHLGRSGSVVLCGEAGIGKSALLRYAAEQALDARILEVRGVEPESGMPFAGLHALFYSVRSYLTSLSDPQRDALSAALGFASGQVSSRFLVAAAVVELLATLAEEQPVLCLIDDAQWIDQQSLASLTFAQRRLRGDRIAMIFATRTGSLAGRSHTVQLLADVRPLTSIRWTTRPPSGYSTSAAIWTGRHTESSRRPRGVTRWPSGCFRLRRGLTCRGSMRRLVSACSLITCGAWRS
jgi:AAA ATPase domain